MDLNKQIEELKLQIEEMKLKHAKEIEKWRISYEKIQIERALNWKMYMTEKAKRKDEKNEKSK